MIFDQKNYLFLLSKKQQKYKEVLLNNIKVKYKLVEVKCLCGNIATSEFEDIDIIDNFFPFDTVQESGGMKVVICGHCGLGRTTPYYNDENIADYYANLYRNIYINNDMSNLEYFDFLYNSKFSGSSAYFVYEFLTPFIKKYKQKYHKQKLKIFEVGCGFGTVLARFYESGEEVYGCDFGAEGIDTGKKKGMKNLVIGGPEQLQYFGQADLIIVNHVLEHVARPKEFLEELKKIMHNRTMLFIGVPDIVNSIVIGQLNAYHAFQDAHIWHFNNITLNNLMNQNGFNCVAFNPFIQAIYCLDDTLKKNIVYNSSDVKITCRYLEHLNQTYFERVSLINQLCQKDARINQLVAEINDAQSTI